MELPQPLTECRPCLSSLGRKWIAALLTDEQESAEKAREPRVKTAEPATGANQPSQRLYLPLVL
jgi:hypothetical protein